MEVPKEDKKLENTSFYVAIYTCGGCGVRFKVFQ
jgi:hypothetical protein